MKKRRFLLCCIAAVFLFLLGASLFQMKQKQDFKNSIAVIPEFCLPQAVDSILFCNTDFFADKPVIVMYFHPECDLCHTKAEKIRQEAEKAKDIQWALVSYAEKDSLIKFIETYHLSDISSLVVLADTQFLLYERLQVSGIPSSFVYDRRQAEAALIIATLPNPIIYNSAAPSEYVIERQALIMQRMENERKKQK